MALPGARRVVRPRRRRYQRGMQNALAVRSLSTLSALGLASALGCGAPPVVVEPTEPATEAPVEPAPVEPAPVEPGTVAPPSAPALYEVHEWGVIDVQEDGRAEVAAGGRIPRGIPVARPEPSSSERPALPMPMRKPVLYFHLAPGVASLAVDVSARITSGTIYETFPPDTRPSPDVAHWSASLAEAHCPTDPEPVIRGLSGGCTTPDGICEVTELSAYDAPTAACVTAGGIASGLLFYRAMATPVLPLRVERAADMSVTVTATGSTEGAPGPLLRVTTNFEGRWESGRVVISRAAIPTLGSTAVLPVGSVEVDRGATQAELDASLARLGLDPGERSAFLVAWMMTLFGPNPGASGRTGDHYPHVPQDSILYFLPEAAVDAMSHLELSPSPSAVRRAFLVRVILPAVETD